MLELGDGTELAGETLFGLAGEAVAHHFDRDPFAAGKILSQVHNGHVTAAELAQEAKTVVDDLRMRFRYYA